MMVEADMLFQTVAVLIQLRRRRLTEKSVSAVFVTKPHHPGIKAFDPVLVRAPVVTFLSVCALPDNMREQPRMANRITFDFSRCIFNRLLPHRTLILLFKFIHGLKQTFTAFGLILAKKPWPFPSSEAEICRRMRFQLYVGGAQRGALAARLLPRSCGYPRQRIAVFR